MVVPSTDSSKRGVILYDPRLPTARVVFSIAHEIIHSFFPNSRRGVQFRAVVMPSSRPGRQLEMLCEFGAALLTMPESAFIASVKRNGFGLAFVSTVAAEFGTSFEATLYRMAQTASIPAAAAKFCYRFAKKDLAVAPASGSLFPMPSREIAQPRYRRQSFHPSRPYPSAFLIPFNKSVRDGSCIYVAAKRPGFQRAHEDLPGRDRGPRVRSLVEAIAAPFQPEDRDRNWPDVLVLIQLITT